MNYREISTQNPAWQSEAEELAREKMPFVVVGFNYDDYPAFYWRMDIKYGFGGLLDAVNNCVFFIYHNLTGPSLVAPQKAFASRENSATGRDASAQQQSY